MRSAVSRDPIFFFLTNAQFSRVNDSSFIAHSSRSDGARDTIDWHFGLGRLGFLGGFRFSYPSMQELQV